AYDRPRSHVDCGRGRKAMITRRSVLSAAVGAFAARAALAQGAYPDRLIKLIVPATAGGQTDVLARLLAQKVQPLIGQSVIRDERGGAGGAIGARAAATAEPDGYTLPFGHTSVLAGVPRASQKP